MWGWRGICGTDAKYHSLSDYKWRQSISWALSLGHYLQLEVLWRWLSNVWQWCCISQFVWIKTTKIHLLSPHFSYVVKYRLFELLSLCWNSFKQDIVWNQLGMVMWKSYLLSDFCVNTSQLMRAASMQPRKQSDMMKSNQIQLSFPGRSSQLSIFFIYIGPSKLPSKTKFR